MIWFKNPRALVPYYSPCFLSISQHPEGELYQTLLAEFSGQQTVPNVYIGGQHIGGCDDTLKLQEDGKLLPLGIRSTNS